MASTKWESCIYTNDEERDFIKGYLGPTLQKDGLSDRKIIAWDHNRDMIYERASAIMSDPDAAKYVWGFGFHWYETWRGEGMMFGNVQKVYNAYPTKNLIFTEGSIENFRPDSLNNWAIGERYGYSMINDFNSGASAWTDWNIFLDQNGGPNHVGNYCFAAIHANTQTGQLTYTNIYYYLGHFSKFIRPQAKRIDISSDNNQLITTAFLNSDGKIAVVVMNGSDKQIKYNLKVAARTAGVTSLPHSITTLLFLK
jgi:glucosylceramidase